MNNNRPFRRSITIHGKHHDHGKRCHAKTAVYTHLQHGRRPLARQPAPLESGHAHLSPLSSRSSPAPSARAMSISASKQPTLPPRHRWVLDLGHGRRPDRQPRPVLAPGSTTSSQATMQTATLHAKKKNCVRDTPRLTIVSLNRQEGNSSRRQPHSLASYRRYFPPHQQGIWILHPPRSFMRHLFIKKNK